MTLIDEDQARGLKFFDFVSQTIETDCFQIYQLAGDASNRRYYRIVNDEKSWVLMEWEPFSEDPNQYPLLSVLNHFQKHKVRTPKIIAKSPTQGLLIQEDLGDLTLERKFWENQNQEVVIPYYQQAIDELIKIHYKASLDKSECIAFKVAFDTEKLLWEMNYAHKYLLEGLCGLKLSSGEESALRAEYTDICKTLDAQPRFICHRDYHSRNLMIKLGKMKVIDFQDARMGPVQYDLVSLLKDSYVDLSPNISEKLLKYYFDERAKVYDPVEDTKEFHYIYEIQSIQRCFKACGSFASFYVTREDTRYLKYLRGTLAKVREALQKNPKYKNMADILETNKVYEKHFLDL